MEEAQWSTELTLDEGYMIGSLAACRIVRKFHYKRKKSHGGHSRRDNRIIWADSINGLMGEYAASKVLGLPWTPGGPMITHGDIAEAIEVRTPWKRNGNLLIYKSDTLQVPFVKMKGEFPVYHAVGWILGDEARCDDFWWKGGDPPCWSVPDRCLTSMERFKPWLEGRYI